MRNVAIIQTRFTARSLQLINDFPIGDNNEFRQ